MIALATCRFTLRSRSPNAGSEIKVSRFDCAVTKDSCNLVNQIDATHEYGTELFE